MTNAEMLALKPGTAIVKFNKGCRPFTTTPLDCVDAAVAQSSGHVYALIHYPSPTGNGGTSTAIESDEYLQAQGYLAHDADGARIRGVEVVA